MTPEQARALLAHPDLLDAVGAGELATAERLRRAWPADLVAAAFAQAELRVGAAVKFDRAGRMMFTRAGLEQASAERVARHRSTRFAAIGGTVVDLCCGVGGDFIALSAVSRAVGVDHDETHAVAARHNAGVYDVPGHVVVADVHDARVAGAAAVFVDPARRSDRGGVTQRGGYSPELDWCFALPVEHVAIKAAPGIDHSLVPDWWEAEFVAVGRELKESVLWSPGFAAGSANRRATVLVGDTSFSMEPLPGAASAVHPPGRYLLDPSPAVTRAGLVTTLAAQVGGWQVDPRIAFLTADVPMRTPFGRSFEIAASLPFGVKPLAAELRRLDVGPLDLRRRGLAGDVDDLRRRLRTSGNRAATVMLTRLVDKPWAFVCFALPDA